MKKFNLIEFLYLRQPRNLVYYDSLTGVRSRIYYDREAKRKYRDEKVLIIYVDIDNLKETNDNYGHDVGNKLIRHTANKLKKLPLVYDICRVGGDEFILICNPNMNYFFY